MQQEERDVIRQYLKMKKNQEEYNMDEIVEELYKKAMNESESKGKETVDSEER